MIVVAEKSSIFGIEQAVDRVYHDPKRPRQGKTNWILHAGLFRAIFSSIIIIGVSGQMLVEFNFLKGPEHALSLL